MRRARGYAPATALLAGLAAGLAHPPFGLILGLLGYAVLLLRLETIQGERPLRSAFGLGWLAGLGYFGLSTWWIAEPFLVEPEIHGWMAPFAVVLMGGGLALFWGAAGLAYRALRPRSAWKPLVFAGVFAAAEWLRGHILTGFPWNLVGESWRAGSPPSQAAALVGAYGLTWITLALASAPALLMLPVRRLAQAGVMVATGIALTALYAGGAGRLAAAPRPLYAPDAPVLRIVQANIDQKEKWKPENLGLVFDAYLGLSVRPAARAPDVVIWPEGALPAVIDDLIAPGSPYATRLRDAVRPGQSLLMGANRAEPDGQGGYRYFNTLVAFRREDMALRVTGVYDKHRLVPFGEFLPLGDLAGKLGIRALVHMPEDFTPGPPPRPLTSAGMPPLQALICYEALFPGFGRNGARPAWLLNVSNDAWFGRTSGPWQHLNIASYRAIEQGLPMVRATPTGVSAVIDPQGRILPGKRLGLGEFGVIDARLPSPAAPTPYSRWGEGPFAGLLLLSAGAWIAGRRRRQRGEPG
ncbi:apolipoprotein N-acyltransferase [Phenylobacterium kunshanense]|uniref:Apolipoprotein N-acyltransferase n=1 Tax=Phenylobacterium kunshanense TaxID=1445034 RepID=A0A328BKJ9_9CAUL|nr:apolipoprotein N-acyltransferase [Phenylobacterium kunshanense]RAK67653.1 apolipoprotein N-acyltransferase [Phenylobacterium kunshanense]